MQSEPYLTPSLSLPEDRAGEGDNYASRCKSRCRLRIRRYDRGCYGDTITTGRLDEAIYNLCAL